MSRLSTVKRRVEAEVRGALRSAETNADRGPMVVAVSGGADSTALLLAMAAVVAGSGSRRSLVACYVDHGLRPRDEIDADQRALETLCASLDVPLVFRTADVSAEREAKGLSWEDAARRCRYAALLDVAGEVRATAALTGHTRDDQVETVLLRLLRGTGLRALRGIESQTRPWGATGPLLVRPLLGVTRVETEAYCRERGVDWRDDSSNRSDRFLRNRVRRELVPLLADLWPGAAGSLARLAGQAEELHRGLQVEVERLLDTLWLRDGDGYLLDRAGGPLPSYLALELVAGALARLYDAAGAPSERHVRAVWKLWEGTGGHHVDLPRGWIAERCAGAVRFTRASVGRRLE